jgi:hypothetical protein
MNRTLARTVGALTLLLMISGCASRHYAQTTPGTLTGDLIVRWWEPDKFEFLPDPNKPLTFVRGTDGEVIKPGRFYTDAGSIPKPFQALKNYSPWGYAPAFIVHDWLFHLQDCQLEGYDRYTLDVAAVIMSEVMKTMMESPTFKFGDKTTVYLMYQAVRSPFAAEAWNDRRCETVTPEAKDGRPPTAEFRVSLP